VTWEPALELVGQRAQLADGGADPALGLVSGIGTDLAQRPRHRLTQAGLAQAVKQIAVLLGHRRSCGLGDTSPLREAPGL